MSAQTQLQVLKTIPKIWRYNGKFVRNFYKNIQTLGY